MLRNVLTNSWRAFLPLFHILRYLTVLDSLNVLIIEVSDRCTIIFLLEHTIVRLTMIKRQENNRTASFSLKLTTEDTDSLRFYDVTSHERLI